jgi:hypothetical protein
VRKIYAAFFFGLDFVFLDLIEPLMREPSPSARAPSS